MKIRIEHNGIGVTATGISDNIAREKLMQITGRIYDMIEMTHERTTAEECKPSIENVSEVVEKVTKVAMQETVSPLIRPRIPNNVVDINELTIEKAVTENALVRCPSCGQAHCLAVPSSDNHIYLMRRDFKNNEFGIISEVDSLNSKDFINMCCKPETNRKAYYEDLQSVNFFHDTDFAVDNNTEIFCPVCCQSSIFSTWKDAFENPLAYFETEHLCDVCGGEKLDKWINKKHIYECDNCHHITEYKEK